MYNIAMILAVSMLASCGFGGEAEFKSTRTSCDDGTASSCNGSGDAKAKIADPAIAEAEKPEIESSKKTDGGNDSTANEDKPKASDKTPESEGDKVEEAAPVVEEETVPVVLLTTFEGDTKAVWKKCADVCHSATGSNRQEKPYLDVYAEAKANANRKTGGHKGVSLNDDEKDLVLKWVADGAPEK